MTKYRWVWLFLIGGCVSSSKFVGGPGPYNIDLDAAAGDYEERFLHVPRGGAFTVTGSLQFVSLRQDPKWAPMAAVELAGPREPYHLGLTASVQPSDPGKIQIGMREPGQAPTIFTEVPMSDGSVTFELHFDAVGRLGISGAGKTGGTLVVHASEIDRVSVLSSTSHVRFSHVVVTASDK